VNRSRSGKFVAAAWRPGLLVVKFDFEGGFSENFKAILPMLKCGVLVNRRVESVDETRDWLKAEYTVPVSSISFGSAAPWAFQQPFKGELVEYRWEEK
jgi:hypothetical protein